MVVASANRKRPKPRSSSRKLENSEACPSDTFAPTKFGDPSIAATDFSSIRTVPAGTTAIRSAAIISPSVPWSRSASTMSPGLRAKGWCGSMPAAYTV